MSGVELPGSTGEAAEANSGPNTVDVDDSRDGGDNILSRLLSTHEPNTTPTALEADYEVPKGVAFMLYGTLQMAETGGVPAIGNVLLGLYLQAQEADLSDAGDGDDDQEVSGTEVRTA